MATAAVAGALADRQFVFQQNRKKRKKREKYQTRKVYKIVITVATVAIAFAVVARAIFDSSGGTKPII